MSNLLELAVQHGVTTEDIEALKALRIAEAPLFGDENNDEKTFEYNSEDLKEAVGHCASTSLAMHFDLPSERESTHNNPAAYNYAEHMLLGDSLKLKWFDGAVKTAADCELTLENGLKLKYGQINGLGGDFFGGKKPICQGKDFQEQCQLFTQAFNCLNKDPHVKEQCRDILKTREEEVAAIQEAKKSGKSTAEAYKKLTDNAGWFGLKEEKDLQIITVGRPESGEYEAPSYLRLAQLNLDHFGADAHTAYNAGHFCAMQKAAEGKLEIAYAMNAFADHYLGDCFAAGHMRTPRRILHAGDTRGAVAWKSLNPPLLAVLLAPDMCSKYMHDEDNALGLRVSNRAGEQWMAFGDKRMFEAENEENSTRMRACLQASADEVWDSFDRKKIAVSDPDQYASWNHAPTLESVFGTQNHSPLFTRDGKLRKDIDNPNDWNHKKLGWYDPWINVYRRISGSKTMKGY